MEAIFLVGTLFGMAVLLRPPPLPRRALPFGRRVEDGPYM